MCDVCRIRISCGCKRWTVQCPFQDPVVSDCRLVRAKGQKVAALRQYLQGSSNSKSNHLDALTLAKMPFIDPAQLDEVYFPPDKIYARQRKRLESEIGGRKMPSATMRPMLQRGMYC